MSEDKLLRKKAPKGGEQVDNTQRTKAVKHDGQQVSKSKKPEAAKKAPKKPDKDLILRLKGLWGEFLQYLREVASELRKVIWPSKKETMGSTAVVLVIVLLSAIYLGAVDAILSRLVRLLVG